MKAKNYFLLVIVVFLNINCEKELDFELPNEASKLVLISYVSGNDGLSNSANLFVGASNSIFENNQIDLLEEENTELRLFENGNLSATEFLYVPRQTLSGGIIRNNYYINRHFTPGLKYRLEAESSEYGLAYAEMDMPLQVPIEDAIFNTQNNILTFSITDKSGNDYYAVLAEVKVDTLPVTNSGWFSALNINLQLFEKNVFDSTLSTPSANTFNSYGYFTDKTFENQKKTINLQFAELFDPNQSYKEIRILIYHLTESIYKYEETSSAYLSTKGNPFAEQVQIYSNVVNGYGVFGGATSSFTYAEIR